PIIVGLRVHDVRKAGCPLELPRSRLQVTLPGQEIWAKVVDLLLRLEGAETTEMTHSEADTLLRGLAAADFSMLARTPPLLYHNDFTSSLPRLYWSEEFGYALWLRLYFENDRGRAKLPCRPGGPAQTCVEK